MKILLVNTHIHGVVSNEETFWSVLADNLSECQAISLNDFGGDIEKYLEEHAPDVLIFNSILGNIKTPPKTKKIVLLQDNFIAMKKTLPLNYRSLIKKFIGFKEDHYIKKIKEQKNALCDSDLIVAVSQDIAKWYEVKAEIIPIGTNTDLFKSMGKAFVRNKYNIPQNKFVKIYVGSTHPVKGWSLIKKEIKKNKNDFYILVLKDEKTIDLPYKNIKKFQRINQSTLSELYNCADLFIGRSIIETLWLAPIEAMFCNVPLDITNAGIFMDWKPKNKSPRQEAFNRGLDRETMIKQWKKLVSTF